MSAFFQSHAIQSFERFLLIGHAVEVLREHDIFQRGEIRDQMKLLEDESDFLRAHAIQVCRRDAGHFLSIEPDFTRGWPVKASDQIY